MMCSINLLKVFVAGLLLVSMLLGAVACSSNGVTGDMAKLVKDIPEGATSFVYWNTGVMAGDSELHQLLDKWKADNETQIAGFGVGSDEVEHFLTYSSNGENVLIVMGDIDLDQVRQKLQELEYDDKDWKHIEIWESTNELDWLAMPEGSLVWGSVDRIKESIDIIEGGNSLYDNQDARDVLDKLPNGTLVHYQKYAGDVLYEGLIASGDSFEKMDKDLLKVKLVYKFSEPGDAESALDSISDEVDEDYDKVNAKQDGRFIIVTAEVEIENLM